MVFVKKIKQNKNCIYLLKRAQCSPNLRLSSYIIYFNGFRINLNTTQTEKTVFI